MEEVRLSILDQLDQLEEIFLDGNRIPFSGNRLVNEQDAIDLLDAIRESVPNEIIKAQEILIQGNKYIDKSKLLADDILTNAKKERNKLVDGYAVKKEAERLIIEMQRETKERCEKMLSDTNQKTRIIENEIKIKLTRLEQNYAAKKQKLEDDLIKHRKKLEDHERELSIDVQKRMNNKHKKSMEQLNQIQQEASQIAIKAKQEAEKIQIETKIRQKNVQEYCEALKIKSQKEANHIKDGANKYAEQVLKELESRLLEVGQVISSGRKQLAKNQPTNVSNYDQSEIPNTNVMNSPLKSLKNHQSKIRNSIKGIG